MEIEILLDKLNFSSVMWEITVPLIFSLADIITGYIQAVINKTVDSQKMRIGLLHKILIILVIVLSFVLGLAFNISFIPKTVCVYVFIMECVSILENLKKAGIDIGKIAYILKEKEELSTSETLTNLGNKIEEAIKDKGEIKNDK